MNKVLPWVQTPLGLNIRFGAVYKQDHTKDTDKVLIPRAILAVRFIPHTPIMSSSAPSHVRNCATNVVIYDTSRRTCSTFGLMYIHPYHNILSIQHTLCRNYGIVFDHTITWIVCFSVVSFHSVLLTRHIRSNPRTCNTPHRSTPHWPTAIIRLGLFAPFPEWRTSWYHMPSKHLQRPRSYLRTR